MSDDKDNKPVEDEELDKISGGTGTGTQFPGGRHDPPPRGTGTQVPHPIQDPV